LQEKQFLEMKGADFEKVLEEYDISKLPKKKTLWQIGEIRALYRRNLALSDEEKVRAFKQLLDEMGPVRLEKYYRRIFLIMTKAEKILVKLKKANPGNALIKESEKPMEVPEVVDGPEVPKEIIVPYPKEKLPSMDDIGFLITHGTLFSIFTASLTGGLWTGAFSFMSAIQYIGWASGLVPLALVIAISFWFVKKKDDEVSNTHKKDIKSHSISNTRRIPQNIRYRGYNPRTWTDKSIEFDQTQAG